jgi:hypothetical protein
MEDLSAKLKNTPACTIGLARRSNEKRQTGSCSSLAREFANSIHSNGPVSNAINNVVDDLVREVFASTGSVNEAADLLRLGRTIAFYVGGTIDEVMLAIAAAEVPITAVGIIGTLFIITHQGMNSGIEDWLKELWKLALPRPFIANKDGTPAEGEEGGDDDNAKCPLKKDAPVCFLSFLLFFPFWFAFSPFGFPLYLLIHSLAFPKSSATF